MRRLETQVHELRRTRAQTRTRTRTLPRTLTLTGARAAASPDDGTGLSRLSTPRLMAAAESELHQVARLGGGAAAMQIPAAIRIPSMMPPHPYASSPRLSPGSGGASAIPPVPPSAIPPRHPSAISPVHRLGGASSAIQVPPVPQSEEEECLGEGEDDEADRLVSSCADTYVPGPRMGYAYWPPACYTYQRRRAALRYVRVRSPASGVPYVPRTVWCT